MTERDIKLLWGRSGNRCAICKTELSQDKKLSSDKFPLGEQAHIVGDKDSAARGKSNLSDDERDGYSNRILLCPNHHTAIDRDETYYLVERLHLLKQQHELWVQERLSERTDTKKQAEELIYTSLIDAAVKLCHFQEWNSWVSRANGSFAHWHESLVGNTREFEDIIFRTAWPKSRYELESALKTLAHAIMQAQDTFMEHCEYGRYTKGEYHEIQFYKLVWHEDQSVYHSLLAQYVEWHKKRTLWLWISTQAANWLCDVVRRDINPLFFAIEGRFVLNGFHSEQIPEFTEQEKSSLPEQIGQIFEKYKIMMFRPASPT